MSEHLRAQWRTASSGITGYLRQVADMQRGMREKMNPDWRFHSIEELILHYGRSYTPAPLPDDIARGEMKMCYGNAANAALASGSLTYVEGYADAGFFPTGHAWVTQDGRTAWDPTWDAGKGYFGVALSKSWVSSWVSRTGYWGIFFVDIPDEHYLGLLRDGLPPGALA